MYQQQQSAFGQPVQSQYRGFQKPFQPTGPVQSFYQPNAMAQAQQAQAQSYHLPNYVGNRPNHDASWRVEFRPSTQAMSQGQVASSVNNMQASYNANIPTSQFASQWQPSAFQAAGSQHLAGYAANRPNWNQYQNQFQFQNQFQQQQPFGQPFRSF